MIYKVEEIVTTGLLVWIMTSWDDWAWGNLSWKKSVKDINWCACELCSLLYIRQLSFSVCVTEYLGDQVHVWHKYMQCVREHSQVEPLYIGLMHNNGLNLLSLNLLCSSVCLFYPIHSQTCSLKWLYPPTAIQENLTHLPPPPPCDYGGLAV